MRENSGVAGICDALKIASECYRFSQIEKDTALMLYRCLKPLWFTRIEELKEAGSDCRAVRESLNKSEKDLTVPVDFSEYMR